MYSKVRVYARVTRHAKERIRTSGGTIMKRIRWVTPWPLIQVTDVDWLIIRDDPQHPAAVVRQMKIPRTDQSGRDYTETMYRIVSWAPLSEDRRLFGWAHTLEEADMAVTFDDELRTRGEVLGDRPPEWAAFRRWLRTELRYDPATGVGWFNPATGRLEEGGGARRVDADSH